MSARNGSASPGYAERIVDRPADGIFLVDRSLFTDPELFEHELARIFGRSWVYLAHESQLRRPGDFLTTEIGRVPVMLVRTTSGKVNAFLNSCAHRGATLCRVATGNRRAFACGYHGWTYDLDGKNVHVKDEDVGAYPEAFRHADKNLTPLARLGSYKGFLFGSLSADVPELDTHLGAAKVFIDMLAEQSPDGMEVLRGTSTYRYRGNWKLQAENGVDGYHFTTVHASYLQILGKRAADGADAVKAIDVQALARLKTGGYDLGSGHNVIWAELPNAPDRPLWAQREEIVERLGENKAVWMVNRMRNLLLYPNVQLMDQASTQIRIFRPISVDETEVKIYCIAPVGESDAARERRIRQYEDFFNASGMATPDDLAEFESCQAGYRAKGRRWIPYERGEMHKTPGADAEAEALGIAPLMSGAHIMDETMFQGQYRHWLSLMEPRGERA
jgi:benzoate/toluate 1,2-dioxygenase subunit alpha